MRNYNKKNENKLKHLKTFESFSINERSIVEEKMFDKYSEEIVKLCNKYFTAVNSREQDQEDHADSVDYDPNHAYANMSNIEIPDVEPGIQEELKKWYRSENDFRSMKDERYEELLETLKKFYERMKERMGEKNLKGTLYEYLEIINKL